MYTHVEGGMLAAKGFLASSTAAGIKYKDRPDMAMLVCESGAVSAAVYTTNLVKAAPVLWDREITDSKEMVKAIVINSGVANACTGKEGLEVCAAMAQVVATHINVHEKQVLVASTGVIGRQMPLDKIKSGIEVMAKTLGGDVVDAQAAARAIMTTDTKPKEIAVSCIIGGKTVHIGGMCKGSGMIHPNMCTMLGFLTTDAVISKELLVKALIEDTQDTYNMISVDGDTSTNDTVVLLSSGLARNPMIDIENEDYQTFKEALHYVNTTLAKMIAADGEGATALFEVKVIGADTKEQAKTLAKSVVTSSLTKAAIFGHDANWGRVLCALGYSGETFDPDHMRLEFESEFGKILIYEDGVGVDFDEERASKILSASAVTVIVDIQMGDSSATSWGCDLTYDYIKINADYRS